MCTDQQTTWKDSKRTVNMTARELEKWLGTEQSQGVGPKRGGGESTGHASGRRAVAILRSKGANFGDDEYAHMRKVVGYAKRHLKQRPHGDVSDTAWRYSLSNWGTTRLGRNSLDPTTRVGSTRTRGRSR